MDPTTQAATGSVTELLRYGIGGVFILALIVACVVLWRTNVALTNQIAKLQEDRIADVRLCTSALVNAAGSMTASADAVKGVQAAITSLVAELQRRGR